MIRKLVEEAVFDEFKKIAFNDSEKRVRAHIGYLFEIGFNIGSIGSIFGKSTDRILLYLQYLDFFGDQGYLDLSLKEIKKRVNDELYKRELEKSNKQRSLFYYLFWPIRSIINTLLHFQDILWVLIAYVTSYIYKFREKDRSKSEEYSNSATFKKGANRNFLLQINKLDVYVSDRSENLEGKYVLDEAQLKEMIEKIILSKEKITFGDEVVDSLIKRGQEKLDDERSNIHKEGSRNAIKYTVFLILAYLAYGSSLKGGIFTVSIIGVSIAISFNGCSDRLFKNSLYPTNPESSIDTLVKGQEESNIDTVRAKIKREEEVKVFNYDTYSKLIDDFFEEDITCFGLSGVGKKQKKFIEDYDQVDHFSKPYLIDEQDSRYYLHVVAYDDIREAAFQMHYINKAGIFNSEILEVNRGQNKLFAVVIKSFGNSDVKNVCEYIDGWHKICLNDQVEVGLIYNGPEK